MLGYIKLYRKLLNNPIMQKPELLQLFIYCLLRANHEPNKTFFGTIDIEKGQFVTGRFELSKDLKVKPSTIYKRLQMLSKSDFLNIESNNKNTLVTIVNWELYQIKGKKSNTKSNNKVTTKEQQSNTNKNDKNVRMKEEKIYTELFEKAYKIYSRPQAKQDTFKNWNKLLDKYTEEQLLQFTQNYVDYYNSIPDNEKPYAYSSNNFFGVKAYYQDFVQPRKWEGKPNSSTQQNKPVNMANFGQRTYDDAYYNGLYKNIGRDKNDTS